MNELSRLFRDAGGEDVRTYIQSGNVVFDARLSSRDTFTRKILGEINARFGFSPEIRLLHAADLHDAIESNPYPQATSTPTSLHVFFLDVEPPESGIETLRRLASAGEAFSLIGKKLYLHAPEGIGRSRLVRDIDRALGVSTTSRNWRTVLELARLATSRG